MWNIFVINVNETNDPFFPNSSRTWYITFRQLKHVTISRPKLRQLHRFDTFRPVTSYISLGNGNLARGRVIFAAASRMLPAGKKSRKVVAIDLGDSLFIELTRLEVEKRKEKNRKEKKRWRRLGEEERGMRRGVRSWRSCTLDTTNNYQRTVMSAVATNRATFFPIGSLQRCVVSVIDQISNELVQSSGNFNRERGEKLWSKMWLLIE